MMVQSSIDLSKGHPDITQKTIAAILAVSKTPTVANIIVGFITGLN